MEYTTQNQMEFPLLDAFLTNKEAPIREFYIAEYPKTKRHILAHGGSLENAKDVFQDAFFSCWKKLSDGKFSPQTITEIQAYLFTAAKNKWIDIKRREGKNREVSLDTYIVSMAEDDNLFKEEKDKKEEQLTITLGAFEKLGRACKELLTQFYFEKTSLKLIAEQLNIEEASAKNKKYRCIQKLKELASELN